MKNSISSMNSTARDVENQATITNSAWVLDNRAWLIWGAAAVFYLYEYILRISPGVMTQSLMRDFAITSSELGFMVSFYYYAYVSLQIPGGVIVDVLGPRWVISFSSVICAIGTLLFVYSPPNIYLAEIGRFLIGIGSACAFLSCLKIGSEWFHPAKFSVISGLTTMMGTVGGAFGKPLALIINKYGWPKSLFWLGILGFFLAIVFWMLIRDTPNSNNIPSPKLSSSPNPSAKKTHLLKGLKSIVSSRQTWLIALFGGLMYIPVSAFAELWGIPYLMKVYNITNAEAATMVIMIFIGFAFGSPTAGWMSEYFKSRRKVMSYCASGAIIIFALVVWVPNVPYYVMCALLFMMGIFKGGQMLNFVSAKELHAPKYSGSTIGFANCIVMMSGAVFQPALGVLLDLSWDGTKAADGTPIYSVFSYQLALTAVITSLIISWILIRFYIKETYSD